MKNHFCGFVRVFAAIALFFGPVSTGAGGPIISEFMTMNDSVVFDEDGDFPDWIEIYNPDPQPLSLAGWTLTDDKKDTDRWTFPAVTVPPGRFLVVFASGKDRTNPAAPLHTNFRLPDEGSYLGLYAPGGTTIASHYDPQYPPQIEAASYGIGMETHSQNLLTPGAAARYLVPTDASLKLTWTENAYDASAWTAGTTGIGFDTKAVPTYADLIATNIQTQMQGINTSVFLRLPFQVDAPAALSGLILRMKYEDGFVAYLNGKEVARKNVPTVVNWNTRASTRRLEKDALLNQDIDLSSRLDLLVSGENLLAIQGLNEAVTGAAFLMVPQLEGVLVDRTLDADRRYFTLPTPGRPNNPGLIGAASMPVFSPSGSAFVDPLQLELSSDAPDAVIHYTIDRSLPNESSPIYSGPIALTKTTLVRARAYVPNLAPSTTVSQVFTAMDTTLKGFTSNLPLIVINTFGGGIPQDPKVPVWLSNFYPYQGRSAIQSPSDLDTQAGVKQRGSSSTQFPKASYTVETWDGNGLDQAVSILGFAKESDWVLYAPYTDKTLMRDVLAYEWSNWIGRYAPRTRFVEVFLTSSTTKLTMNNYQGVYVFEERIKQGKDRVDIDRVYRSQNTEPEVSGGYILKKDRLDPGDGGLQTTRSSSLGLNQVLAYVNPKERDISATKHLEVTAQQKTWLKGYLDKFETALYGANFKDPVEGYAKYIDVDSFIDHHILTELCKNIDGYRLSTFMFKDRQGKLNMGPLWDFNLSLGNADYLGGWDPTGWYYVQVGDSDYPWWRQLFLDPAFYPNRYTDLWFQYRQNQLTLARILASIDEKAALLQEAQVRNYKRWPILGIYVWPNPQPLPKSYAEEIAFMKTWVTKRLAWMDSQFIIPPAFSEKGGLVNAGTTVALSAKLGIIYYTLDLSDPKLANEGVSPTAVEYATPVVIEKNTRIRARVKLGAAWSNLVESTYVTSLPPLTVSEFMYRAAPPPVGSTYAATDIDYVEIENIGDADFDMSGVQLTDSVRFNFNNATQKIIPRGGRMLVVKKLAAFNVAYPTEGVTVVGEYLGSLADLRGTIGLKGSLDEQIVRFTYEAVWYPETAGAGRSMVAVDSRGPRENWAKKENWRPSTLIGGSPGLVDPDVIPTGHQVAGDINQDGKLGISDALGLLRTVFLAASFPLPCGDTAAAPGNKALLNLNGDAAVDQSDAIFLLSYLFQRGAPPAQGLGCVEIADCPNACTAP